MTGLVVPLVRSIAGLGAGDRPLVGGKAASLGELAAAGVRVPSGFVVTTVAFERAMAAFDPGRSVAREVAGLDPDDHDAVVRVTAGVRERVRSAPPPGELAAAIAAAYDALGREDAVADGELQLAGGPDGVGEGGPAAPAGGAPRDARPPAGDAAVPVAVRSSATAEDSAEASFAGLQDTYLWVRGGDAVVDRVRACWASLYSVESVSYRLRRGLAEEAMAMAVVVQRMVDARCSGVMFTRSPTTGDRSVVAIEASWGLGSAVVSGLVTPDTYVVNKVTGELLERTVASKRRQHRPDPAGQGVVEEEVPEELRGRPCLSDEEVGALLRAARRVEEHYGSSQDVEWAIGREPGGGLFLLQSRPETVWSSRAPEPVATPKARAFDHVVALLGSTDAGKKGGGARR